MIRMTLRLRRVGGDSYENYIQRGKELLQSSFTCWYFSVYYNVFSWPLFVREQKSNHYISNSICNPSKEQ